jgi:hypothetical protein
MPQKIERLSSVTSTINVTASAGTSQAVPFGAAGGGMFIVDALAGGASSLSWHVAFGPTQTPVPANDGTADVTTSVVVNKAYPIPDALFAAPFIVAVANAGTASIRLCVKG